VVVKSISALRARRSLVKPACTSGVFQEENCSSRPPREALITTEVPYLRTRGVSERMTQYMSDCKQEQEIEIEYLCMKALKIALLVLVL
jgi:hypothetical protein